MEEKTKVIAYIIRTVDEKKEILVFKHKNMSEAGIQVPGGTVDKDETLKTALFREVLEETGLTMNDETDEYKYLGMFHYQRRDVLELNKRHVFQIHFEKEIADQWDHNVTGSGEDKDLVFSYYWLSIDEASKVLCGNFAEYFPLLR